MTDQIFKNLFWMILYLENIFKQKVKKIVYKETIVKIQVKFMFMIKFINFLFEMNLAQ